MEYKVEIHCSSLSVDCLNETLIDYPSWDVYCFFGDQKIKCGRYLTPIEAGKAAKEMDSFFKFLAPSFQMKEQSK